MLVPIHIFCKYFTFMLFLQFICLEKKIDFIRSYVHSTLALHCIIVTIQFFIFFFSFGSKTCVCLHNGLFPKSNLKLFIIEHFYEMLSKRVGFLITNGNCCLLIFGEKNIGNTTTNRYLI